MDKITKFFDSFKEHLLIEFVIAMSLIIVGVYVTRKIRLVNARLRNDSDEGTHAASGMMTNFRELHAKGELSDEEYRTIKTNLVARLRDELNDTDQQG